MQTSSDCSVAVVTEWESGREFILKSSAHSLEHEHKLQSSLRSPHIAKVFEHFYYDGKYHILMEYCEQLDLFEFLENKELTEEQARRVFRQLAEAISVCHQAKIAHLDIKPENCFLDSQHTLKLGDFGAAKSVRPGSTQSEYLGTTEYMSPQQLSKRPYDPFKADLFAAGKLLFEITLNFSPFRIASESDRNYQLLAKGGKEYWERVKKLRACSESLVDLLQGMLQPEELHRVTVEEVLTHPWVVDSD